MRWNHQKEIKKHKWKTKFAIFPLTLGEETIWLHFFQEKLLEERNSALEYIIRVDEHSSLFQYTYYIYGVPFSKMVDRRSNKFWSKPEDPKKKEPIVNSAKYSGNNPWGK